MSGELLAKAYREGQVEYLHKFIESQAAEIERLTAEVSAARGHLTKLLIIEGDHMTHCDTTLGDSHPCTCGAFDALKFLDDESDRRQHFLNCAHDDWLPLQNNMKECTVCGLTRREPVSGSPKPTVCEWFDDDDGWHSGCGRDWEFFDDGPSENGMRFCLYCGKPVTIADFVDGNP